MGTKTVYYICPNCLKDFKLRVPFPRTIILNSITSKAPIPKSMYYKGYNLVVACEDCDEYMFECDEYMYEPIIKFNMYGFETLYCCEGHEERSIVDGSLIEVCMPYIIFRTYGHYNQVKDIALKELDNFDFGVNEPYVEENYHWADCIAIYCNIDDKEVPVHLKEMFKKYLLKIADKLDAIKLRECWDMSVSFEEYEKEDEKENNHGNH